MCNSICKLFGKPATVRIKSVGVKEQTTNFSYSYSLQIKTIFGFYITISKQSNKKDALTVFDEYVFLNVWKK